VLFLHGWGLGHAAYHRALRRLILRGCRVIAPSMPGFGGTAALPRSERSLGGYAAWVDDFLEHLQLADPVLVLGHSFGGGVATRFTHDFPEKVRYLVLLNSVGDPTAFSLSGARGTMTRRGPGRLRFALSDLVPSPAGVAAANRASDVFLRNLITHPTSLAEVAALALTADLRGEMAVLAQRKTPVLVLWSDRDGLIPLSAFDTFCSTFGTDGHVVSGGHSWLLTDPDVFGEVLDNVIRMQRDQVGTQRASDGATEVRRLLHRTTMPARTVDQLVDGVTPMWVLSEAPSVLAADLALCHPPLAEGEVRAVARPLPAPDTYRVTVAAADRRGLLADTAARLSSEGLSIRSASVTTWPDLDQALHSVTVEAGWAVDDDRWQEIGRSLAELQGATPTYRQVQVAPVSAAVEGESSAGSIVRVAAPDAPGLLSVICRWFADQGLSIEAAHISTVDGMAEDLFLVGGGTCDTDALVRHIEGDVRPGRWSRLSDLAGHLARSRCGCRLPGRLGR
jgi:pimeloyl-ACP methyl ester carboxylesterase/glycine cleavage system regulatory protein